MRKMLLIQKILCVWKSYHRSDFADTDPLIDHDSDNDEAILSSSSSPLKQKNAEHHVQIEYELDVVVSDNGERKKNEKKDKQKRGSQANIGVHADSLV